MYVHACMRMHVAPPVHMSMHIAWVFMHRCMRVAPPQVESDPEGARWLDWDTGTRKPRCSESLPHVPPKGAIVVLLTM